MIIIIKLSYGKCNKNQILNISIEPLTALSSSLVNGVKIEDKSPPSFFESAEHLSLWIVWVRHSITRVKVAGSMLSDPGAYFVVHHLLHRQWMPTVKHPSIQLESNNAIGIFQYISIFHKDIVQRSCNSGVE